MNKMDSLTKSQYDNYVIHTYNRFPITLDYGEGVYLYDVEGNKYLDFTAGIAVFALGYQNKELNDAIKVQLDKLVHTSNLFYNEPAGMAAEEFCKASGMSKVFFTNSGTEAVEGVIKLARKYYFNKTGCADGEIIAMNHSFHGRSMGALSVTGNTKYQQAFGPMLSNITFATYNDIESVKALITDKTCGILLETVQGEGGIYPATKEFLTELRALCDELDILLMLDEIQCGMGRTGAMFAYQNYGIMPDAITSAKALGCGIPVGLFAAGEKAKDALVPGDHGTTYGGNPLAAAAICKVFELYNSGKILSHVQEVGAYLEEQLEVLKNEKDTIADRRGFGLMQGIELTVPVTEIIQKVHQKGILIISAGTNVIRFVPPLIIEKQHVDQLISVLKEIL